MQLSGRTALITGASRGLGKMIARSFIREGADVLLVGQDVQALQATTAELTADARPGQHVISHAADVSRPDAVQALVGRAESGLGQIDVLVCNAGIQGPLGPADTVPWDAWARTVEVNLFGTVLCCRAVLPSMRERGYGKIIVLSGGGATGPRPCFSAYAASKAAVVRFAETLATEVEGYGIDVNAVAPGALNTRLLDEVLAAGAERVGSETYEQALRQQREGGTPLQTPADLVVFLGSADSDGISGRLVAAVWDDWRELPRLREWLKRTDVYTLRRIVPEDRRWVTP